MADLDTVQGRNDAYCAGYEDGKAGRPFSIPAHLSAYSWDYQHGWDLGKDVARALDAGRQFAAEHKSAMAGLAGGEA